MASLLCYLTKDLNLLSLLDCNIGLTTKCATTKVSENVKKDEPLSQTRVDMTNTQNKTLVKHQALSYFGHAMCLLPESLKSQ